MSMLVTKIRSGKKPVLGCLVWCFLNQPFAAAFVCSRAVTTSLPRTTTSPPLRGPFVSRAERAPLYSTLLDYDSLTSLVGQAFRSKETDGVMELAREEISLEDCDPQDLIFAALEAVNHNKGQASGIINSYIGGCCRMGDEKVGADVALRLLEAYEDAGDEIGMKPDVVTYSLVYSALTRVFEKNKHILADLVLEKAIKLSTKKGGSKRRKSLASSKRRKEKEVFAKDLERDFQQIYGPEFRVLHETGDLLVLSKPSGMVCFHKHKTTSGKISSSRLKRKKANAEESRDGYLLDVSLEDALLHKSIPLSSLNAEGRGLVHRIDRGTSGCIVLAKNNEMHARLVTEFFLRNVRKKYVAVVSTTDDAPKLAQDGVIDVPVGGRPAKSSYRVTSRYGSAAAELEMETFTGRKHQLRVHCAKELGAPVLLDPIHHNWKDDVRLPESVKRVAGNKLNRFFLHASALSIPTYELDVEAPLPDWWNSAVQSLEE